MFEPSIDILLNKTSGELVLDDELIGSRAGDVESQNHSDCKAGKDGPVADAVADSHLGINFGFRLRLSGESELDNIRQLLDRLPTLKSVDHDVEIKFDRGYGKMTLLSAVGIKGYSMRTIACEIGSKHPFIKAADAVAFKESLNRDGETDLQDDDDHPMVAIYKELEPFILDGTDGCAQVTSAKR